MQHALAHRGQEVNACQQALAHRGQEVIALQQHALAAHACTHPRLKLWLQASGAGQAFDASQYGFFGAPQREAGGLEDSLEGGLEVCSLFSIYLAPGPAAQAAPFRPVTHADMLHMATQEHSAAHAVWLLRCATAGGWRLGGLSGGRPGGAQPIRPALLLRLSQMPSATHTDLLMATQEHSGAHAAV